MSNEGATGVEGGGGDRGGALPIPHHAHRPSPQLADALVERAPDIHTAGRGDSAALGRRQLLETILFGRYALSEKVRARTAAAGVDPAVPLLVAVAAGAETSPANQADEGAVTVLAETLADALRPHAPNPFVVQRDREVVAVIPLPPSLLPLRRSLEDRAHRLLESGIRAGVGISGPCAGLIEVPMGYLEAIRVLRWAASRGGVASAAEISLFDYVLSQTGSAARRIVPTSAHALLEEDGHWEGALLETLTAYLDNDMSVERAAVALAVHPNTVYYRLGRITGVTGVPSRKLWALVDLLAGVRLLRDGREPHARAAHEAPILPSSE
jgi:hypothetical protein